MARRLERAARLLASPRSRVTRGRLTWTDEVRAGPRKRQYRTVEGGGRESRELRGRWAGAAGSPPMVRLGARVLLGVVTRGGIRRSRRRGTGAGRRAGSPRLRGLGEDQAGGAGSPPVHAGVPAGRGISSFCVRVIPRAREPGCPSPRGRALGGGSDHHLRRTHRQTRRAWSYRPPTTCSRSAAAGRVGARLRQTPLFTGSNVPGARCCLRKISDTSVLEVAGTRVNPQDEPLPANLGSGTVWT